MLGLRIGYKDNKTLIRKTFKEYIATCRVSDSPSGDFIADSRNVHDFPDDILNWRQLKDYLRSRNACREAIEAARTVFWNWKRSGKRVC